MKTLTSPEELTNYGTIAPEVMRALFIEPSSSSVMKLREVVRGIITAGADADVCLAIDPNDERWIVNVRANGGETPPERHRDWHDCSLYLLGGNDIAVGGMMDDAEEVSKGEWRKGSLKDSETLSVRAGDLLWVPADVPHRNNFQPHTAFVIVKIKKGRERNHELLSAIPNTSHPALLPRYAHVA